MIWERPLASGPLCSHSPKVTRQPVQPGAAAPDWPPRHRGLRSERASSACAPRPPSRASSRMDYLGEKPTTCMSWWLSIILGLRFSKGYSLKLWSLKMLLNKESCQISWGEAVTAFYNWPVWGSPYAFNFIWLTLPVLLEKYLRGPYFVPGMVLSALQIKKKKKSHNNPMGLVLCLVLFDKWRNQAQEGEVTCPKLDSKQVGEPRHRLTPASLFFITHSYCHSYNLWHIYYF